MASFKCLTTVIANGNRCEAGSIYDSKKIGLSDEQVNNLVEVKAVEIVKKQRNAVKSQS